MLEFLQLSPESREKRAWGSLGSDPTSHVDVRKSLEPKTFNARFLSRYTRFHRSTMNWELLVCIFF